MSFEEDLAAQVAEEFDYITVPVKVNGNDYAIRITQMGGLEWADEVDRHPIRPDVEIDRSFGYNLRSVTTAVLKPKLGKDNEVLRPGYGQLLRDGVDQNLTPASWDLLLRSLDGGTMVRLGNAVFTVNEADRVEAILAAGKALAGESDSNSTSPASSESPRDDLTDGSPSGA